MWNRSQEQAVEEGPVGEARGDSAPQAPSNGYRSESRSDAQSFPCPNLCKLPILALKVGDPNQKSVREGTMEEIGARAGAIVPTNGNCWPDTHFGRSSGWLDSFAELPHGPV